MWSSTWSTRGIKHLSDIIIHNRVHFQIKIFQKIFTAKENWITQHLDLHYDLVVGPFVDVLFKEGKHLTGRTYSMLLKEQSKHYSMQKLYDKGKPTGNGKKECMCLRNSITTNENLQVTQWLARIYYTRDSIRKFQIPLISV